MKSIEEVQKIVGLSRRMIQEFEKAGLAQKPDKRNKYGHLLYEEKHIERLWQLRFYKELNYKKTEIKDILENESDEEMILEHAIDEMIRKREMLDNLISIAQMLKESGMSFNSMRHCFSDVKLTNPDHVFNLMAASAQSLEFWDNVEYVADIPMAEEYEDEILDAIRNILLLRERKMLFTDSKVMEQVEAMYKVSSEFFSDSLIFFRGSLIEYLPGSKMARWLDKEWGEGTAGYIQDAVEHFCGMNADKNMDQIWITAFDKIEYLKNNGYVPDSDKVQQEILKIYQCVGKSKWLTEAGKYEALRKLSEVIERKAFRTEIDRISSDGTAIFCSEAIKYFYVNTLKRNLNEVERDR